MHSHLGWEEGPVVQESQSSGRHGCILRDAQSVPTEHLNGTVDMILYRRSVCALQDIWHPVTSAHWVPVAAAPVHVKPNNVCRHCPSLLGCHSFAFWEPHHPPWACSRVMPHRPQLLSLAREECGLDTRGQERTGKAHG